MAKLPIEVAIMGTVFEVDVKTAIDVANSIQDQFVFQRLDPDSERTFKTLSYRTINTDQFFEKAKKTKDSLPGFHPFLVLFLDASLEGGGWSNLFSDRDSEAGIAISTIKNVQRVIIPRNKMTSYYLYYLGRHTLNFIVPRHFNHHDTRECVFDFMKQKKDILLGMKSGALCDECRDVLSKDSHLSPRQLEALDRLFHTSGGLLANKKTESIHKPKVFIGSSVEALRIAKEIKRQLGKSYDIDIWDKDTVFDLGQATIEALEAAVQQYSFGIFVFSPDDELLSRGTKQPVARDNVIFESGLFIGKLSRFKAFVVQPSKNRVVLPSDLRGMITAMFDPSRKRLSEMLRPAVKKIRAAIDRYKDETVA